MTLHARTKKGSRSTENEETQTKVAFRHTKNKNYPGNIRHNLIYTAECLLVLTQLIQTLFGALMETGGKCKGHSEQELARRWKKQPQKGYLPNLFQNLKITQSYKAKTPILAQVQACTIGLEVPKVPFYRCN